MEKREQSLRILWQTTPQGGARVLRVFGQIGVLQVPESIEGVPVTEIGAYCFAENEHLPKEVCETVTGQADSFPGEPKLIAGNTLEEICLPDSVTHIQNLAFYNCRKLHSIEIGTSIQELGSDVFMNCRALHRVRVRGQITENTGIRDFVTRLSQEILVEFWSSGKERQGALLYPEYYESYDEIAPAHLFGRNIEGEGFRARQAFQDGKILFEQYDSIFEKIVAEESALTAVRFAFYRLKYPVNLRENPKNIYEKNLGENLRELGGYFVELEDLESLCFLCQKGYLQGRELSIIIQKCLDKQWTKGSVTLMNLQKNAGAQRRKKRYEF